MGWTLNPNWTLKSLIKERVENWNNKDSTFVENSPHYIEAKCLRHCYRGNAFSGVLWKVWEHTLRNKSDDSPVKTEKWIGVDLLKCYRNKGYMEWGYKDMEEGSGPCASSCPLSYLDMVPCPGGYAVDFRARVVAYHQSQKEKRQQKKLNSIHHYAGTMDHF